MKEQKKNDVIQVNKIDSNLCPDCKFNNSISSKFCGQCGSDLKCDFMESRFVKKLA